MMGPRKTMEVLPPPRSSKYAPNGAPFDFNATSSSLSKGGGSGLHIPLLPLPGNKNSVAYESESFTSSKAAMDKSISSNMQHVILERPRNRKNVMASGDKRYIRKSMQPKAI